MVGGSFQEECAVSEKSPWPQTVREKAQSPKLSLASGEKEEGARPQAGGSGRK